MKRMFGMFALTKAEQRTIVLIIIVLMLLTWAKQYREVRTIRPAGPVLAPQISGTPAPLPEEERANADDSLDH
jgi:hypothetical protein